MRASGVRLPVPPRTDSALRIPTSRLGAAGRQYRHPGAGMDCGQMRGKRRSNTWRRWSRRCPTQPCRCESPLPNVLKHQDGVSSSQSAQLLRRRGYFPPFSVCRRRRQPERAARKSRHRNSAARERGTGPGAQSLAAGLDPDAGTGLRCPPRSGILLICAADQVLRRRLLRKPRTLAAAAFDIGITTELEASTPPAQGSGQSCDEMCVAAAETAVRRPGSPAAALHRRSGSELEFRSSSQPDDHRRKLTTMDGVGVTALPSPTATSAACRGKRPNSSSKMPLT